MASTITAVNPMEYNWTPERLKVLAEFERRIIAFNKTESMVRQDRAGRIAASEVYHALEAVTKFREFHGITKREMTAYKSRSAVKCSTVAQAVTALSRMFSRKAEKAA